MATIKTDKSGENVWHGTKEERNCFRCCSEKPRIAPRRFSIETTGGKSSGRGGGSDWYASKTGRLYCNFCARADHTVPPVMQVHKIIIVGDKDENKK